MKKFFRRFIVFLGFCFLLGGVLSILQLLGIGNFPEVKKENIASSILIAIGALVLGVALIYLSSSRRLANKQNKEFSDALKNIKMSGYRITYANRNTGTISYMDSNNEVRSISIYRGYNSHH